MKNKFNYLYLSLLMAGTLISAQERQSQKAKKAFEDYAYAPAIEKYETLVEKGFTEQEIYKNLGDANYQNAKYSEAATWYSKLFTDGGADIDPEFMYKYALSLKSTQEYEAAAIWMEKFRMANGAEVRAIKIADKANYLAEIEKQSGRYEIKNLGINSRASDFAPAFNGEQLVFSTARDSGNVTRYTHQWNDQPFLNLYSASQVSEDYGRALKLDKSANKKTHESSAVFTKDGSMVYFTRNNSEKGRFSRDKEGVSRLKIYRAKVENDSWLEVTELPFNSDDYSSAHPTLSPDESKLYFASDMPGSVGNSDIFVVNLNGDGSIGAPVNLGNVINTEARETFPFVTSENVLYFASDGHPGLGGLDIFATSMEDIGNLNIVNVGKPVNSEQDDFSFIINEETKKGFFASNRHGGKGSDDIYSFIENEEIDLICNTLVNGVIKDKETGEPLEGASIAIVNSSNEIVSQTTSGSDGSFALDGDCRDGDYNLVASKEDYNEGSKMFAVLSSNDTEGVELNLVKTLKRASVGTDLIKFLDLEPVYFDLDKADIRPDAAATILKILAYMKAFPDLKVQVQSHTDVKASTSYNYRLSQRRAENTIAYLVANGVDSHRIPGQGFGKTKLINECSTRESCPDEKHQENRRSEFIVIE
ncbi:MAG: OmpA family protein [Flavobacteriaceae bacterium]